ncbi:MAG: GntR family transcriptional regulator [Coriobacteriales bacterium]|jgi:DNA-binding transcriptional regulator YhcF (GntR family)|nr:GntR family transcriptional regulator [Coriobacteriales bacterium]
METKLDNDRPIYLQVKEAIADAILAGEFVPGSAIPSNSRLVELFKITPVTVQKASDLLVAEGLVRKQRGVGMFVTEVAPNLVRERYREGFRSDYLEPLLHRARQLQIGLKELWAMLADPGVDDIDHENTRTKEQA